MNSHERQGCSDVTRMTCKPGELSGPVREIWYERDWMGDTDGDEESVGVMGWNPTGKDDGGRVNVIERPRTSGGETPKHSFDTPCCSISSVGSDDTWRIVS